MKKNKCIMFILLIVSLLTSCSTHINFSEYINKNKPLKLRISKFDATPKDTKIIYLSIPENSDKIISLIHWAEKNQTGWHATIASYNSEICVTQDNFRILFNPGSPGVIIGFSDKDNNPKQYSKSTKIGELDFLIR